ncbi:MAG: molybdopterin-dependent oxidoreductase [Bryobacteraceae bacterium]|jgi:hypothetical protein
MTAIRLVSAFAILIPAALCQPPALLVDGGNGKTVTLTAADLSALPQHKIDATEHGTPASFDGVLLSGILAKVDMPSGEKMRGKLMSLYLLVEAADGYRVVFALPDLDAAFTDRKVYLATRRDGKALPDKEGPFRIVVPDDKRPARWVRQVTALRIRQAN